MKMLVLYYTGGIIILNFVRIFFSCGEKRKNVKEKVLFPLILFLSEKKDERTKKKKEMRSNQAFLSSSSSFSIFSRFFPFYLYLYKYTHTHTPHTQKYHSLGRFYCISLPFLSFVVLLIRIKIFGVYFFCATTPYNEN